MNSESNIKLAIALVNLDLDAEAQEQETRNLLREIKDLDVESAELVEFTETPEGAKSVGGFLLGVLQAEVSIANLYPTLELEIKNVHSQFDINTNQRWIHGSGEGIQKLIEGGIDGLDFALSSRDLRSDEKSSGLEAIKIVPSGLAVAVNPQLNVNSLTKKQLQDIFTGNIRNWNKVVPSEDIPITPYVRGNFNSGSVHELKKILGIEDFGSNTDYSVNETTAGIQKVAQSKGGIFVGQISEVVPQCKIKTLPIKDGNGEIFYPYQQRRFARDTKCPQGQRNLINIEAIYSSKYPLPVALYVIVKKNGRSEEQAGQAYADLLRTKQGQEIIKKLQETGNPDLN